jgi:ABC-type transport system involved in multi-copper enzyme maturation permease subunit
MLGKLSAIALNTYRENVRARLLHGLFALAVATVGYSLIVGAYAFKDTLRVVSDLSSASISLYGIVVAVVLGATSLHRELELKTAFPILARPVARTEYLVAKFLGSWLTLFVFVAANCGMALVAIAVLGGAHSQSVYVGLSALVVFVVVMAWRLPRYRTYLPLIVAVLGVGLGWFLADVAPDDRRVLIGSTTLSLCEIAVVIAIANLFASFSSPFLTAMLTLGIVVVGRSADTLARLPERVFGDTISSAAKVIAKVVPNLMTYVPARPLLTGELPGSNLPAYVGSASIMALGWILLLLTLSSLLFSRRDFT